MFVFPDNEQSGFFSQTINDFSAYNEQAYQESFDAQVVFSFITVMRHLIARFRHAQEDLYKYLSLYAFLSLKYFLSTFICFLFFRHVSEDRSVKFPELLQSVLKTVFIYIQDCLDLIAVLFFPSCSGVWHSLPNPFVLPPSSVVFLFNLITVLLLLFLAAVVGIAYGFAVRQWVP